MKDNLVYLDTNVIQQDLRIRLPKAVLENLQLEKGKSKLSIYLDVSEKELVLKPCEQEEKNNN